jgi:hypothetical protein
VEVPAFGRGAPISVRLMDTIEDRLRLRGDRAAKAEAVRDPWEAPKVHKAARSRHRRSTI